MGEHFRNCGYGAPASQHSELRNPDFDAAQRTRATRQYAGTRANSSGTLALLIVGPATGHTKRGQFDERRLMALAENPTQF